MSSRSASSVTVRGSSLAARPPGLCAAAAICDRSRPSTQATSARSGTSRCRRPPRSTAAPARPSAFSSEAVKTVYFAGDTDLFPGLEGLADPLDVALLPIWGWGPTLGEGHLDPERAAEAVSLLRPRIVIPIHWGSLYPLGMSHRTFLREPPEVFRRLVQERSPDVEVRVLAPGAWTSIGA